MSSPMQMPMLPKFAAASAEDVLPPFELGEAVTIGTPSVTSEGPSPVEGPGLTLMEFLHTIPSLQVTCKPAILSPKKFLSVSSESSSTNGLQTAFGSSTQEDEARYSKEECKQRGNRTKTPDSFVCGTAAHHPGTGSDKQMSADRKMCMLTGLTLAVSAFASLSSRRMGAP